MSSTVGNKGFWRVYVLVVIGISLLGPWAFDVINVPAEYPCDKPFIRLYGDYCGYPILGFQAFFMFIGGLFNVITGGTLGSLAGRGRELTIIVLALMIIILPIFSTVLSLWKNDARRWRVVNLTTWGLACLPLLLYMFLLSKSTGQLFHAWGVWIYIFSAIGTIIFEVFELKPGRNIQQQ